MRRIYLIFLFFTGLNIQAQIESDTIQNFTVEFGIKLNQLYTTNYYSNTEIDAIVDPIIEKARPDDGARFYSPFNHSGLYFAFTPTIKYKNILSLDFKVFFEQRGWSIGANYKHSTEIFPEFNLKYNDKHKLLGDSIDIKVNYGNIYNKNQENYGLRLYNMDFFGISSKLTYKNKSLNLLYCTGASYTIGLSLDELIQIEYLHNYKIKNINYSLGFQYNLLIYFKEIKANLIRDYYSSYAIVYKADLNENFNYYAIIDYTNRQKFRFDILNESVGFLSKISYKNKSRNLKYKANITYVHYGREYIKDHYNNPRENVLFRYRNITYPYQKGDYVYPLKSYFRPLSQWALYTEYQNNGNIKGIELSLQIDWNFYKKLHFFIDIENVNINRFNPHGSNTFSYLYFASNLYINLTDKMILGLYLTNKQMNLDVNYPTFYQLKHPLIGFNFKYSGLFHNDFKN